MASLRPTPVAFKRGTSVVHTIYAGIAITRNVVYMATIKSYSLRFILYIVDMASLSNYYGWCYIIFIYH